MQPEIRSVYGLMTIALCLGTPGALDVHLYLAETQIAVDFQPLSNVACPSPDKDVVTSTIGSPRLTNQVDPICPLAQHFTTRVIQAVTADSQNTRRKMDAFVRLWHDRYAEFTWPLGALFKFAPTVWGQVGRVVYLHEKIVSCACAAGNSYQNYSSKTQSKFHSYMYNNAGTKTAARRLPI